MGETETQILSNLTQVLPEISETGRERLLGFVEGMAFAVNRDQTEEKANSENEDT